MFPSIIYNFKIIEKIKNQLNEIHYYKTMTGIDEIEIQGKKVKIYLTEKNATVYAWNNIKIDERQKLKDLIINKYKRTAIIKNTLMGYIIPDKFEFNKHGMFYEEEKETKDGTKTIIHNISDRWLFVTSRVYSLYHGISQFEVTSICPTTKKSKTELCDAATLGKWNLCIEFLMNYLAVSTNEGNKRFLSLFFNRFTIDNQNNENYKTKSTVPAMGWNQNYTDFFPYSNKLHLDFRGDNSKYLKNTVKAFKPPKTANYDKYIEVVKKFTKNKDADFIYSSAFAAPLISILGIRSFVLNFYGKSGSLKSFASLLAMSIFAKPSKVKSSSSDTKLCGFEILAKFKNLPYYFDEIKDKDDFDIYIVGNEAGRHRLNKAGNIQEKTTWRTIVLTTSEYSLHEDDFKAGEINRFLSLEVDCSNGLNEDIEEFARKNYQFIENNYALLGEKYIKFIIKNKKKIELTFEKILKSIKDDKKSKQYAYMIAAVCTANYIYRYLFLNETDLSYSINLGLYFMDKIELASELDQFKKMYETIRSFYEINQSSFEIEGIKPKSNFYFGKVDKGKIIFIIEPLREYLDKKGFKWNQIKTLRERGWIEYKNKKIQNAEKYDTKRVIINLNGLSDDKQNELDEKEGKEIDNNIINFER